MDIQQYLIIASILPPAIILATTFATVLFLYRLLQWRDPTTHSRRTQPPPPPEAGGSWPIIGHLHLLMGPQPPYKTLARMADKHGPIFTIRMGVHRALVVSSSEIARECFTTNDKAFANRPKGVASEVLTYNYAIVGFSPYGPYWRRARKIATLELLSNHRLEALRQVRESEVKTAVRELYELWANKNEVGHVAGTEMKRWLGDITLNTMFRIVVGKRYLEATSMSESGDDGDRCRKALRDFFEFVGSFVVSDAIPWLRWLDLGGHEKAMKETARELDRLAERWLEEHKRKRASGEGNDNDFMAVMLSILDAAEFGNSSYDADTINKAMAMSLILAATDTTTVTMTWALALLLNNKEVLKKAQQELDQHVGRDRQVNESDLKNLVYLQAIVKETLRLYPAGPLLVPHESIEDCTVAGYHVPARTRLLINVSKLHRDPRVWSDDADEFRPERFLSGNGKSIDVRGQSFELLPFSSGRRMCPGVSFALQITQLSLAALIQGFDVTTPSNEPVDMVESAGLTNLLASPLDVLLTPRLPADAY